MLSMLCPIACAFEAVRESRFASLVIAVVKQHAGKISMANLGGILPLKCLSFALSGKSTLAVNFQCNAELDDPWGLSGPIDSIRHLQAALEDASRWARLRGETSIEAAIA